MPSEPAAHPLKHKWIFPLIGLVLVISAFQGIRMGQDRREATEEQYQSALARFGQTDEEGDPLLDTRWFAYYAHQDAIADVTEILRHPESNDLAKIQAMEVLAFLLEEDAVPLLLERIENEPPPVRDEAQRLVERIEAGELFQQEES